MKRRNTPSKEAVLNLLKDAGKAMSHDAIEKQIAVDIDRATIYRVLNSFCTDGLVHRIVAEDGKQYFAVCNKCEDKQEAADLSTCQRFCHLGNICRLIH